MCSITHHKLLNHSQYAAHADGAVIVQRAMARLYTSKYSLQHLTGWACRDATWTAAQRQSPSFWQERAVAWIVGQAPVDIQNFHRPLCLPGKALLCSTHDSPSAHAHMLLCKLRSLMPGYSHHRHLALKRHELKQMHTTRGTLTVCQYAGESSPLYAASRSTGQRSSLSCSVSWKLGACRWLAKVSARKTPPGMQEICVEHLMR